MTDYRGLAENELIVPPDTDQPRIHPDRCPDRRCRKRGCPCRTHTPTEMVTIMFGPDYRRSW